MNKISNQHPVYKNNYFAHQNKQVGKLQPNFIAKEFNYNKNIDENQYCELQSLNSIEDNSYHTDAT